MTPITRPAPRRCVRCSILGHLDRAGYCPDCARRFAGLESVYYWDLEGGDVERRVRVAGGAVIAVAAVGD